MNEIGAMMGFSNLMPETQFLGNLLKFGDVRCFSLDKIFDYYALNDKQVRSAQWLSDNFIPIYAERNKINPALLKASISFHRVGMVPGSEMLVVSAMVLRIDAPKMQIAEVRQIQIGRQGGRRLLNPRYERNWITGDWVLKAEVSR